MEATAGRRWAVQRFREGPGAFHARPLPGSPGREVWVCDPDRRAVVLGSTQREDLLDAGACASAGVEVVRRRSGGGLVLVAPEEVLWVDVIVPAGDPLWEPDVSRAFLWLGDVWAAALGDLGIAAAVHPGPMAHRAHGALVCFAGLGPGEVTVAGSTAPDGRAKVVGVSQRRTREAARFQCAALLRWDPGALVELLAPGALPVTGGRAALQDDLRHVAAGLDVPAPTLLAAFLRHLP